MKLSKKYLAFALLAAVGFLQAKESVLFTEKAQWKASPKMVQSEKGITLKGNAFVVSKQFPVDPQKKYTISGVVSVKNLQADMKLSMNLGFFVYDANGRVIFCKNICVVPNTFAKVLESAKKGDKFIIVDKATKLGARPWNNLAINAKEDLSDLPNRNIVAENIKAVEQTGQGWKITFASPLRKDVPAGTFIRLQSTGGYLGTGGNGINVTADPKAFTGTISGFAPKGIWTKSKWPVGTAKAAVFIQPSSKAKDIEIHFDKLAIDIE